MRTLKIMVLGLLLGAFAGAPLVKADDDKTKPAAAVDSTAKTTDPKAKKPKPYFLKTCAVSDEKFGGDMGDPFVYVYGKTKDDPGREIKFCCKSCVKDFEKDPKKFLKKIDLAEAKAAKDAKAAAK